MPDDILLKAKERFEVCQEDPAQNRQAYEDDTKFVRLLEQWSPELKALRKNRPCLTIDKLGPVIRQVVNDSRQNKPSIKVHPVDSGADVKTANVIDGLIRNIEYTSNADVAYDTAVECAVGGGFGYLRVEAKYAYEDTFEMDLAISRIANPLCVYPDPNSTAADSSDWDECFVVNRLSKAQYEAQYGGEEKVDWDSKDWHGVWLNDEGVLVAEWWVREEYEKEIVKATNGQIYAVEDLETDEDLKVLVSAGVIVIDQSAQKRKAKCHKVTQYIFSGAKLLETTDWPGKYIPIIPVYGDEFWVDGKRYLRSLIHPAIDAQKMFNVMRSTATELFGLSPKVPWIGPANAFNTDINKWNTANTDNHPFIKYDGQVAPIRIPLDPGPAAGAMSEALSAADDIKSITGIHDASLGARSNETSGRAIMARQREGDVSTFHFLDNLRRAIRHTGRVIVDLIPHYYNTERIVRVIGEDGKEEAVPVNQQTPQMGPDGQPMMQPQMGPNGQPMVDPMNGQPYMAPVMQMHDLTYGKYDVTVSSGPSFTTRREEAAMAMTEAVRSAPMFADLIVPEIAKVSDWPGADKLAEKMEQRTQGQVPPQIQKQMQEGMQRIQQLEAENAELKQDQQAKKADIQSDAEVARFKAELDAQTSIAVAQIQAQADAQVEALKARLNAQAQAQRPIVQAAPRQAA